MVDDDLSCPECDRSFDNEVRLEIHMESQHRTVAKIESEPETKVDVANSSLLLFPTGKFISLNILSGAIGLATRFGLRKQVVKTSCASLLDLNLLTKTLKE